GKLKYKAVAYQYPSKIGQFPANHLQTSCLHLLTELSIIMRIPIFTLLFSATLAILPALAQSPWERIAQRPSTLGLENGTAEWIITPFKLKLLKASQTVAGLIPLADTAFDYTPHERLEARAKDGLYHLGDINFRVKTDRQTSWQSYSTATKRAPVIALTATGHTLAAANLSPTLPADVPLAVKRYWQSVNGDLVLRFE